jgi:flagellar protein FlaG
MAIDSINRLPSKLLDTLQSSRSVPAKENRSAQVRQPSSSGDVDVPEKVRIDRVVDEAHASQAVVDEAHASQAVVDLNDYVQRVGRDLHFSLDKESGKTIIKVLNSETKELVRQIPADEVLALAEILEQTNDLISTGLLEKA